MSHIWAVFNAKDGDEAGRHKQITKWLSSALGLSTYIYSSALSQNEERKQDNPWRPPHMQGFRL